MTPFAISIVSHHRSLGLGLHPSNQPTRIPPAPVTERHHPDARRRRQRIQHGRHVHDLALETLDSFSRLPLTTKQIAVSVSGIFSSAKAATRIDAPMPDASRSSTDVKTTLRRPLTSFSPSRVVPYRDRDLQSYVRRCLPAPAAAQLH